MTRVLYLARHGETDWNAAGRWQGHADVPLNANGHAQALKLAHRLRDAGIAAVASSDLSRARTTADIVARALGVPAAYVDADLRERGFGRFEGMTHAECEATFPDAWAAYAVDPRTAPPDGEAQEALERRMLRAIARAAADLASPGLLVGHGGAIRALVGRARGEPVGPVPNGGGYRLVVVAGRITVAEPFALHPG